jgi:hexosaminidase
MGWEEIDHFCPSESGAICYAWLNSESKPLQLAEAGYQVVIATASHLYFDFAYCNHHQEKGLSWGGYTDEYRSFDWLPAQHPNITGMNAQLWSEVIRSFAQVEWQIYPKIYGLAERAWNNRSTLSLSEYNDLVYNTFLPQLAASNRNFHIQQPGIKQLKVEGRMSKVEMNKVMQGGEILYRLDDGEWQTYTAPVEVPNGTQIIQAKVLYLGKESNTTWLWLEAHTALTPTIQEQNTGATF